MHQRGRLAGAGPGHDQQRPVAVRGRLALLRIQPGQQVVDRGGCAHETEGLSAMCRARQGRGALDTRIAGR